eukprot:7321857-Prymnesium_polylepis.1
MSLRETIVNSKSEREGGTGNLAFANSERRADCGLGDIRASQPIVTGPRFVPTEAPVVVATDHSFPFGDACAQRSALRVPGRGRRWWCAIDQNVTLQVDASCTSAGVADFEGELVHPSHKQLCATVSWSAAGTEISDSSQ